MIKPFPIEYSVVSASALQQHLHLAYELPSGSTVSFLNQGLHDVYYVSNGAIHLILKIYRKGSKTLENLKAELDVLMELKQRNIDVSVPYKDREGQYFQELVFPEGNRYAVVFMYAPGTKMRSLNEETASLFGRKLASLHLASHEMEHEGLKHNYFVGNIFDSALENISSVISDLKVVETLRALYFKMDGIFERHYTDELKTGICHGDAHYRNAHVKLPGGRVTFYDFDLCGNGYFLYDIGSFCYHERNNDANIVAFLSGYNEVLPLTERERHLIPFFSMLTQIFHVGLRAKNNDGSSRPLWLKDEVLRQLSDIQREVDQLNVVLR